MDISSDRARLNNLLRDLRVRWDQVQDHWNDPVRRDFERTHWLELEARVQAAMQAMDHLAQVMVQLRQDCS